MRLRYLQNIPIYFPSGKYKLSIRSFIAAQYLVPNDNIKWWCPSQKVDWWMIEICKFFLILDLTIMYQAFHLQ